MDLFCVACHYSNRNGSADMFLEKSGNQSLMKHAFYLKDNTIDLIVKSFIDTTVEKCQGNNITWKNAMYLWKLFLEKNGVPNIAFSTKLKPIFASLLEYSEETDTFLNVTSTMIPVVGNFIKFWDENMSKDEDEIELEIEEILHLFKTWSGKSSCNIGEDSLLALIHHYYPDVIVEEDKYIQQITCKLWDKKNDILSAIAHYKTSKKVSLSLCPDTTYNVYEYYCKLFSNKHQQIVSKRYFEKTLLEFIEPEYLDPDNLILPTWWNN
jgi:hypothetical protein